MIKRNGLVIVDSLAGLCPAEWDELARDDDGVIAPALTHAFLRTLEETGCVGANTGWIPKHATLWRDGRLTAAMPLYEKQHSYGEYVFDWAWADAYARHGLSYYPKWVAAIPFTPTPGRRVLGRDAQARLDLLNAVLKHACTSSYSSLHILFMDEEEAAWFREAGLLLRSGVQFHWKDQSYRDFDDFVGGMNHDKRKRIRQERRRASEHALELRWLDGHSAKPHDWAFLHRCYAMTYALHRSTPYLSPRFFTELARRQPDAVRLLVASRQGQPVASAFFLCDEQALYGRYWGAIEPLPFLHFELCYYQAIEYCIASGRARFEGGAQGEHKLARGLQPVVTRSAHWIREPRFRHAVEDYLAREAAGIDLYVSELENRMPFRSL